MNMQILPSPLEGRYTFLSTLKDTPQRKVMLIHDSLDGQQYVLKLATGSLGEQLRREHEALTLLCCPAFPRPMQCFTWQSSVCSIRAYVPGITLAAYAEGKELAAQEVVSLTLAACDIAEKLHSLSPALIHRDLSPHNFILQADGTLTLIDLDSIHTENAQAPHDTILLGTPGHAAPEQYGAGRSDVRTDIHGLGKLMVYLLTNDYDPKRLTAHHLSMPLRRIIRRCLQYDPARRYASVEQLRRALLACQCPWPRMIARVACAIVAVCGIVALASLLPLRAPPSPSPSDAHTFISPLIEQAVREQLNKPSGVITYAELGFVNEILLIASEPFSAWEDVSSYDRNSIFMQGNHYPTTRGSITALDDLQYMPNLHQLALYDHAVHDLSPIAGLPLTHLALTGNPVSDLRPLKNMKTLLYLDICGTLIQDLSPLASLTSLKEVRLNDSLVQDISPLTGPSVESLTMGGGNTTGSLDALSHFPSLTSLWIAHPTHENMKSIETMSRLDALFLNPFPTEMLSAYVLPQSLTSLGLGGSILTSIEGIEALPSLRHLMLNHNPNDIDMTPLAQHPSLQTLPIEGLGSADLSPIADIPYLRELSITREQLAMLPPLDNAITINIVGE